MTRSRLSFQLSCQFAIVDINTSARASSDSLDQDSRVPGVCQSHHAYPCLLHTRDELLTLEGQYVCSALLSDRVHQLSIAPAGRHRRRPARKHPYHGGRRKQGRTIPIIVSDRPASQPRTLCSFTIPTFNSTRRLSVECDTNSAICYSNLIKIGTSPFIQELSGHFKVMLLNSQSVRNKTTGICDHMRHANVDLVYLCETWLRPEVDESDCVVLTPPGFCLRSFPRQYGAGGGLAVLYRNSLRKKSSFHQRFCFHCF